MFAAMLAPDLTVRVEHHPTFTRYGFRGGCRCQAMAITKDPRNTDPACSLSPYHAEMVRLAKEEAARPATEFVYRNTRNAAEVGKTHGEPLVPAE